VRILPVTIAAISLFASSAANLASRARISDGKSCSIGNDRLNASFITAIEEDERHDGRI
jgi:hypothetical protein